MLSSLTWGLWDQFEQDKIDSYKIEKHERKRRKSFTSEREVPRFERIIDKITIAESQSIPQYNIEELDPSSFCLDWDALPESCVAAAGGLGALRAERKTQQIENLLSASYAIIQNRLNNSSTDVHIIEFCGGAGYVAIPLAGIFRNEPRVRVTLLDMKERSLEIAKERIMNAGLKNILIKRERLEDFDYTPFDLGIALHACGAATDISLDACLSMRAAYVMSPCCVGKLQSGKTRPIRSESQKEGPSDPGSLQYPRSQVMSKFLTTGEWACLAKAADFGHREYVDYNSRQRRRRIAKCFIEHDRQLRARQFSYCTHTSVMTPRSASPKNDMIVGWPREWQIGGNTLTTDQDLRSLEAFLFQEI